MTSDGAKAKFTQIYEEEHDTLFRFCYYRVSDRERALELTQEAFVKLLSHMYQGKSLDNPRAFLYTVARNLIIDWYRKSKSISLENWLGEGERVSDIADEDSLVRMEVGIDAKHVMEAINKLNQQYRDVVYLRFVEDLNPREIALRLNMSANAVSIRISRGLDELRKILRIDKD